jgi:hypothetical protein
VTINGNLRLDVGASLNAVTVSTVQINGNVIVGTGALLGLGCTVIGVGWECAADSTDHVTGNIVATAPLTMYLDGVVVGGSVVSRGGGPGVTGPFYNFAVKDNTIGRNLTITGWQGGWLGVIRNTVTGNISLSSNAGSDADFGETDHNAAHNLKCVGNTPAAQYGDAAVPSGYDPATYYPNTLTGHARGECQNVVLPTIGSVTPASGSLAGGNTVTIRGRYFGTAPTVEFGTVAASSVTVNPAGTLIRAVAPAQAAGTYDITVTATGGTSATSITDTYTFT